MHRVVSRCAAAASCLILAACAPSTSADGPKDVFAAVGGFDTTIPTQTLEINDIGIDPLRNTTHEPVRVLSVTFLSPPPQVHTLNVRAYNYKQTKQVTLGGAGDLAKECPATYVPHAVNSFVTPSRSVTPYFIVIAFTISKPGRYHLAKLIVQYESGGHKGWQYQNINATIVVRNPPLPGPRPVPPSSECG
jgi:hypothetical protein